MISLGIPCGCDREKHRREGEFHGSFQLLAHYSHIKFLEVDAFTERLPLPQLRIHDFQDWPSLTFTPWLVMFPECFQLLLISVGLREGWWDEWAALKCCQDGRLEATWRAELVIPRQACASCKVFVWAAGACASLWASTQEKGICVAELGIETQRVMWLFVIKPSS